MVAMTMDHGQWPHHYALVIMWMEWCVELYDMWIEMTSITSKQNLYLLVLSLPVAIMNRNGLDRDWCPSLGFRVKMPWSSAAGHMERETSQKLLLCETQTANSRLWPQQNSACPDWYTCFPRESQSILSPWPRMYPLYLLPCLRPLG